MYVYIMLIHFAVQQKHNIVKEHTPIKRKLCIYANSIAQFSIYHKFMYQYYPFLMLDTEILLQKILYKFTSRLV